MNAIPDRLARMSGDATILTFRQVRNAVRSMVSADEAERLASAWRIASQDIASDIIHIRASMKVIAERNDRLPGGNWLVHSPAYVEICEKRLPWQLSIYLGNLRTVSETEAAMDAAGIPFARSSDAWSE
ncbi:hypothetical protein EN828_10280 [Mesorhizobium sp. M2D.F.Ca.ET.185.01.1.1]|uniref:hypothetical protein n=1 Tax=unclassified Mesorhizobium TaxID=325217 RepID=UPI000FDB9EC4|nr:MULTISPECIES: hypothetical protein [unclassified Mesorhizobium]TGQ89423.1 hypothetical protein EN849_09780 [Mesorhizobium sp. M2D.F.Ca.ET.206.01.1.1]TGS32588.1 hypothetical protein EN828_10280 [Mesorhizobium sp. M2D.F.Ca.ET.185.01.1.1]TGU23678.1 hypothetical protein EN796_009830 [Mesorhizobium sp. M2D.F.Ca.ET.153.01.1.1]